jgi:hypothetical protein
VPAIRDIGWLDLLTRTLNSDPAAIESAYAVYGRLDELADSPVDGFAAALYADFIPAQAAAIRRAVRLMREHAVKMEQESSQITFLAANVELVRAGFEAFSAADVDGRLAPHGPDFVNLAELPGPQHGREV